MSNILERINVCLSCDENYAQYAGVVIASTLANARAEDYLQFYILDKNISQESKEKILSLKYIKDCDIEFIQVNEEDFEDYKMIKTHPYISLTVYLQTKISVFIALYR